METLLEKHLRTLGLSSDHPTTIKLMEVYRNIGTKKDL